MISRQHVVNYGLNIWNQQRGDFLIRSAFRTDIGLVRQVNEDRVWATQPSDSSVAAIVADGMGGHQAGDVASAMAVTTYREAIEATNIEVLSSEEHSILIQFAVDKANEIIYDIASRNEQFKGMGTTVATLIGHHDRITIGHVGDSRAYLYHEGQLALLTFDHTFVNELAKKIPMSAEQVENHPRRHYLSRAVGTDEQVETDLATFTWTYGDRVLLCTDGLTKMVPDNLICNILAQEMEPNVMVDELVGQALRAGGRDNITVVVLQNVGHAQLGGQQQ